MLNITAYAMRKSLPARIGRTSGHHRHREPRQGSALMIVLVLMGMLSILGVLFYTFSAQERSNAEYYSEAAKASPVSTNLDADTLFDWGLDQIIVGTDGRLKNSMLWGSRYSLLSNSLGFGVHRPGDTQPFNGEGINLIYDANGKIAVDQNRDGFPDDGTSGQPDYRYLLDFVDTEAAPKQFDTGERQLTGPKYFPQADVGYTYPDINNLFLTYVGKVRDLNGITHQVVKPAYHVPGLLRQPIGGVSSPLIYEDTNNNGVLDPGEDLNGNGYLDDWMLNPNYAGKVMRAHASHLFVPGGGLNGTVIPRYLTDAEAISLIGPTARGFPFHPMDSSYNTNSGGNGASFLTGKMGAYSKIGQTAGTNDGQTVGTDDPIEFDYDNDGDGYREAILMDLDFPVQRDANGKLFVPMYLITIHDQDGLINLNLHGNLAKVLYGPNDLNLANTPVSNVNNSYGTNSLGLFDFVSKSNLGLSPSEINPLWALNARVGIDNTSPAVFGPHAYFFGNVPNTWAESANMELTWSKIGRIGNSSAGFDWLPGVYGDEANLYNAIQTGSVSAPGGQSLPRPGIPLQDDNGDIDEGQQVYNPFVHPLDYKGEGSYLLNDGKRMSWSTQISSPNRWIKYTNYGDSNADSTQGNVGWGQNSAGLMVNPITQGLGDDVNEIAWYADRRDIDRPFKPDEMLYLNLANTEIDRLSITSRLAKLLPFNFAKTLTDNVRGDSIRRKFTVETNDRKSFGLPFSARAMGPPVNGQTGNGQEYSFDTDSRSHKFPPQFGSVQRYSYLPLGEDPIRYATRSLLEVERVDNVGQMLRNRPQRKLSINHLLTGDANNPLAFRQLTPHPLDPGVGSVSSAPKTYPPTTDAGREYWARSDRQKMARDIYVLLYLMGHGDDAMATAITSNVLPSLATTDLTTEKKVYSEPQLREMAQFAVNLVDSMDRDNVITRFEYDKDLSDGWNLDDDPYAPIEASATPYTAAHTHYNPSYPNDSATRGEVYGVERLDMTLSESLAIKALKSNTSSDYSQTNFNEGSNDRYFFYAELRNHSPFPITFDKQEWQIVLRQEADGGNPTATPVVAAQPAWERRLTIKDPRLTIDNSAAPFVIGTTDATTASTAFSRSTFAVDPNWAGIPSVRVVPNKLGASTVMDCDLDLIEVTNPSSVFKIEDENGNDITATSGAMLSAFTMPTPVASVTATRPLKVQLRRRAHPTRNPTATVADNPWVEVDSMLLKNDSGYSVFDMGRTPTATEASTQLKKVISRERPQPFDGGLSELASLGRNVATTLNTLGAQNSTSVAPLANPFTYWQVHFDRDFASVMDLLYLPLYGPHQVTSLTKNAYIESPYAQLQNPVLNPNWITGPTPGSPYSIAAKSASSRFMSPEDPTNAMTTTPNRYLDNRWHRVLELLEVPTRTNVNLGVGTDLSITRVPGKMNLNTLRNAENLAALLDDKRLLNLNLGTTDPDAPTLDDLTEPNRDWWQQFLFSRDAVDPSGQVAVPLPGLPGSKPFRSLADVGYSAGTGNHASVEETILRSLPNDHQLPDKRRLFEIGNSTEHQGTNTADPAIDPYIRNRLLAKIAGNTTTRSNCFGIFISVKYFQAVEQNGAIRIGGPLNGKLAPEHRGFFVVDRSKLEAGQTSPGPTYDFRAFVDYRKTLQTQ